MIGKFVFGWIVTILSAGPSVQAQDSLIDYGPREVQSLLDQPIRAPDDEIFYRLFYQLNKIPESKLSEVTGRESTSIEDLNKFVQRLQFRPVKIKGQILSIQKVISTSDYSDDFPAYFRCHLTDDFGNRAVVMVTQLPIPWLSAPQEIGPVEICGIVLGQVQSNASDKLEPHVIGKRLLGGLGRQTDGLAILQKSGVDLNDLSLIEQYDRQPLNGNENQIFFQFLKAVEQISQQSDKIPNDPTPANLIELLQLPGQRAGDRVQLTGRIIRVTPVYQRETIPEQSLQVQYYQVDLASPLPENQTIAVNSPGFEPLIFKSHFPVTLIVPANLHSISELKHKSIAIDGFMYRFWNYESTYSQSKEFAAGQYSPLIFAHAYTEIQSVTPHSLNYLFPTILFGCLLLLFGILHWGRKKWARKIRPFTIPPTFDPS